jgi:uncharacterized damage-inducible protein DinB
VSGESFPPLDITAHWGRLNDELVRLVDYVPDDQMNWSPRPDLWNFRGILLHISAARDGWMGIEVGDGDPAKSVYETAGSKTEIQRELGRSWERLRRFLADPDKLSATYQRPDGERHSGHWIAFHAIEHDVHHRADILHYLALLGIEHPEVGTP